MFKDRIFMAEMDGANTSGGYGDSFINKSKDNIILKLKKEVKYLKNQLQEATDDNVRLVKIKTPGNSKKVYI